ncbi:MAG: hypothetical protein H7144_14175 [Burkholderiales bacterium]|nr:hypothetical protein [Phycisphaerae bacterium]
MNKNPAAIASEIFDAERQSVAKKELAEQAERAAATTRYFELIAKDNGTRNDAEELIRCAKRIGKDHHAIGEDRAILVGARESAAQQPLEEGAETGLRALESVRERLGQITQAQLLKTKKQFNEFDRMVEAARGRVNEIKERQRLLKRTKSEHPQLLASVELPPDNRSAEKFDLDALFPAWREWANAYAEIVPRPFKETDLAKSVQ